MSTNAGVTKFEITKTELHVPVVSLKTEDNNKLNELSETGFESVVNWNECKGGTQTITQAHNDNNFKRIMLDGSYPGASRLFVMGFNANAGNTQRNSHQRYFLPRKEIKGYNFLIDGRNFYDQNVNDQIKKYQELREIMIGKENYETGSLLDYVYYKKEYKLVACNLSKQKILDSNPRNAQQIEFIFKLDNIVTGGNTAQILTVLEKGKEAKLGFSKGTVKIL